jgi:leucyl-tRNA synthetase
MDYKAVHKKWDEIWKDKKVNDCDFNSKKPKYYCLEMWPYPSAAGLHLGHAFNFMPADTHARFKKMQGYNVYEPMGFDAFGLPSENHALKTGTHPKENTAKNIANMRRQLESLGCMFDWNRVLDSSKPEYYKWTQWLFVKLFENGLAYQKEAGVNWCDNCKTVIANEQVINGECERCHSKITRTRMKQWFFKITAFAEDLLSGLNEIDWPEKTKIMQRNWIGKSAGTKIKFTLADNKFIEVFTTRADTLFGASFLAIAPEHPLVQSLITEQERSKCEKYIKKALNKSEIERSAEKTGVWTGSYAINPINNEEVPVWIADYVLGSYGTGAVMGVPAHDTRDFDFAKVYSLPIKYVVVPNRSETSSEKACEEEGKLIHSGVYSGCDTATAREKITADLAKKHLGEAQTTYRLRDWSIGRQRYWGCPIPIVYCPKCGTVADTRLPVILPELKDFKPKGSAPLASDKNFVNCTCPKCGGAAKRETETMDTFVCSSFYFLRFLDTQNDTELLSKTADKKFMPVDKYVGGAEHACMHLLYARFIMRFLNSIGIVKDKEPFRSLVHQGMILGPDGTKMSKSRGNIIEPDKYLAEYGSDLLRLYMLFGFNYVEGGPWNDNAFKSTVRFADRINMLIKKCLPARIAPTKELLIKMNQTIKSVTGDYESFSFNTAVACCMELVNAMQTCPAFDVLQTLILLLAPMMPHLGEEWWQIIGGTGSVFDRQFPIPNEKNLISDKCEIAVQINSKIISRLTIATDSEQSAVENACKNLLMDKNVKKVIYVKNNLINFIVN